MLHLKEEATRCLLCEDAPCTKACRTGDPARAVRAIRFDNCKNVWRWIEACSDADLERAEQACIHYDRPIRIKELIRTAAQDHVLPEEAAPSLAIDFCGIHCENPFFLASSAVCTNYEMVARAFDMGWGGVFYKTICKQDIREVSPRFDAVKNGTSFAGFRNMEQLSENYYTDDFDILRRLKRDYPSKVVVASIMGQYEEEWSELAMMAEEAGCDAVELNFSCPQMRLAGMGSDVGQNPELVAVYTTFVKSCVNIPVIPKMTPNITHMRMPALGAYFAGADAISAINTVKSVTMSPEAAVSGKMTISGYSGPAVKPIALRFIYQLASHKVFDGSHGKTYMAERQISRLQELVGEQLPNFVMPSDLDRDTKVYPKIDRERCIGCGRCYISCRDGGHQAIAFDAEAHQPRIIGTKCVGCHLCRLVCPTGAIGLTKRVSCKR